MKNKNLQSVMKKTATVGMTAAMMFAMSIPAFADVDGVKTVSDADGAKIQKTLNMAAQGVTVPDATFTFTFQGYVSTLSKTTGVQAGPAINPVSLTSGANGDITSPNGSAKTANLFKASDFSAPGIYGYIVKESKTGFTGNANHVMNFDKTDYYVEVKVINDDGTQKIAGITAQPITYAADGTTIASLGDKINGSGDGNDAIPFTNKYTEWANDDPTNPDNPGEDEKDVNKGLVVSKSIKGEGADVQDKFLYKISFMKDDNNTDADGNDLQTTVTDGDTIYSAAPTIGNKGNVTGGTAAASISYGKDYYFVLGQDDSISFKLPAGTKYKVTEVSDTKGYTAKTEVTANGAKDNNQTGSEVTEVAGEKLNTVAYTNNKDSNPLTGILNNYGGALAVVAVAAGGMIVLTLRRRRSEDAE